MNASVAWFSDHESVDDRIEVMISSCSNSCTLYIPFHSSRFRIICPRFSGGTCSGKTSVASLLGKALPWCQVVNQDKYYHEEDSGSHVRNKVIQSRLDNLNIILLMFIIQPTNLINWEVLEAFNMEKMKLDIEQIRQNVRLQDNIAF